MAHLYTYVCMHIITYLPQNNLTVFFLPNLPLSCQCYFFPANFTAKTLSFLQVVILIKLTSIKFPSCHLLQVNNCQNFIFCLITKIHAQKQKQSLILFHLFGMMITFRGSIKIIGNAYGVIKNSKESMLLRLLLTYWGRRVCILKVVMHLRTKII